MRDFLEVDELIDLTEEELRELANEFNMETSESSEEGRE